MHSLSAFTIFTFGDRVKVQSHTQKKTGFGKVVAITIDDQGNHHYTVALETDGRDFVYQPGILANELCLVN